MKAYKVIKPPRFTGSNLELQPKDAIIIYNETKDVYEGVLGYPIYGSFVKNNPDSFEEIDLSKYTSVIAAIKTDLSGYGYREQQYIMDQAINF